jgi:hypothetical protein
VKVYALTETGEGKSATWVDVGPNSPIGQMFRDPTVHSVTVNRTPDGEILKGAKSTIYERYSP